MGWATGIPARDNFSLPDHVQTGSGSYPSSFSMDTQSSFPRDEAAGK